MRDLLAIDPGCGGCGLARFRAGVLVEARYVPVGVVSVDLATRVLAMCTSVLAHASRIDHEMVVEEPRVHDPCAMRRGAGADPNDLIRLAMLVGALLDAYAPHADLAPLALWRGTAPKPIIHERVIHALSLAEAATITWPAASLRHNVLDAIGIGLWRLGRVGRGCVARPQKELT